MIQVDYRTGSKEFAEPLLKRGLPVEITTLEYGDFAFLGNGPEGLIPVGIERKELGSDLLACIRDGRLSGKQLAGLLESYSVRYLLVEGAYIPGADRELLTNVAKKSPSTMVFKAPTWGRWQYTHVSKFLFSMEDVGMRIMRSLNFEESVQLIHDAYSRWQKQWEEHESHKAIYKAPVRMLVRPSTDREWRRLQRIKVAMDFPGIGQDKAEALADHFPTIRAMVNASAEELQSVAGIGKKLATDFERRAS